MIGNLGTVEIMSAVALILAGIWYYLVPNYNLWKKLGIRGPEPSLFFGNLKDVMLLKVSIARFLKNIADQYPDAPLIGIYVRSTPVLIVRAADLIKDVLIKDFSNFSSRGIHVNEKEDPLSQHLFNLDSERWRPLRSRLSPAFTSGKMKNMFTLINECAEYFERYVDTLVTKDEPIDCKEVTAKYTTDVIGSCAFGLEMNSIGDEDSKFRKMGRKIIQLDRTERMMVMLRNAAPWLYGIIGQSKRSMELSDFFTSLITQAMDYRRKNIVHRPDILDILMDLQDNADKFDFEMTESLIASQAFVFFAAGFETSSSTISNALYELAQMQGVQDKLRAEIIESLESNNGQVSYDSVKQMKYLDMVFKETLRLRPPVIYHMRRAVNDYTFSDVNVTIPKGQRVWIPVYEIHMNPEHYPKPEIFDPERFSDEMSSARHPMTYIPFGDGPRNCIGARFAIYQSKLGLIKILAKYKVEVCEKTAIPYEPSPTGLPGFLLDPVGGIHLKFSKIHSSK